MSTDFHRGRWDGTAPLPTSSLPHPDWCESPSRCHFSPYDGDTGERWHQRTFGTVDVVTATVSQREHALSVDGPSTLSTPAITVETGRSGQDPVNQHQARELSEALNAAATFLAGGLLAATAGTGTR